MALEEIFVTGATDCMKNLVSVASKTICMSGVADKDLQNLRNTLEMIAAVTSDAEMKQVKDQVVRLWLRRLQNIAYDIDDVLDEMSYEAIRRLSIKCGKLEKVRRLFIDKFDFKMVRKFKSVNEELDDIAKQKEMFFLEHGDDNQNTEKLDRMTTSFIDDFAIFGRENDRSRIVKMLLMTDPSENFSPSVISIVGMGGLGKTTLAQLVYKDHSIERSFEPRVWLCISDNFDIFLILRNILESITEKNCDLSNVDVLVRKVREGISGRKYLLVLDDLWNENAEDWEKLRDILSVGAQGSKILITTRKYEVASIVKGTIPPYNLTTLTDQECWSIIKKRAFSPGGAVKTPNKLIIGEEIARKCVGLPLAATFLGSLLRLKKDESDWLAIRDDDVFNTPEKPNNIIQILKMSYDNLPSHLKRCFSYCCLFPKGWIYQRETLIHLWMAEGFLHPSNGGGRNQNLPEDIGNHYFCSLLSNSFFQDVEYDQLGNVNEFKMHDLVHDLAQSVVDHHEVAILNASEMGENACDIRRLQLIIGGVSKTVLNVLSNAKKLRTIFCKENAHLYTNPVINKHLRVIYSLSNSFPQAFSFKWFSHSPSTGLSFVPKYEVDLQVSPSSSFEFIHLRYLDLSRLDCSRVTNVQVDSISRLYNLQTLNLNRSLKVSNVLRGISSLENLRHLNLSYSDATTLPDSIVRLTNLQTLDISHCTYITILPTDIGCLQNLVSLGFNKTSIKRLPDSFGELINLRSLNLGDTKIKILPQSLTSNISKLESVNFGNECNFPKDIKNWVHLRCFVNNYNDKKRKSFRFFKYQIMPTGIEMLTRLEVLDFYIRNKKDGTSDSSGIEELAGLNSLRELTVTHLDNVRGKTDAERAKLEDKQSIQKLFLIGVRKSKEEVDNNSFMVLEGLKPHPNLELLSIRYFGGVKLPKWVGSSYCLPNLVKLYFLNCESCEKLPALGMLLCLRVLHIESLGSVKCLGTEFYHQQGEGESSITTLFPSLIRLRVTEMNELEEWAAPPPPPYDSFPVLKELFIGWCPKLTSIPDLRLCTSLKKLKIRKWNSKESIPYDLKNLPFLEEFDDDHGLTQEEQLHRHVANYEKKYERRKKD